MVLRYLIRKEFLQIRRNAFLPRLILVFPIMIMCVMPWVMNMEVKNIVVDVVDNDRSSISSQLVGRIESSDYFILGGQKLSYQEALGEVENSKADLIVEIQSGTIEAMNVTPVSKVNFILAKLIPYWLIALVVMSMCLLLAWGVYGITSAGSLALVYLLAMLLAFIFSGLGLVISNYNDTMQQAVFVMWFAVVCLMLLSGLFTPVRSMPHWAYLSTYVNPMHYFIDAIRTVFVRGGNFSCIAHQVFALSIIAFCMNLWAVISYRKNTA